MSKIVAIWNKQQAGQQAVIGENKVVAIEDQTNDDWEVTMIWNRQQDNKACLQRR